MKSKEIKLTNSLSCAVQALEEVERASVEANLEREQANLLRLLAEEMISMTTDILDDCRGSLWLEWEGKDCELHLTAVAPIEEKTRAAFIEASKSKVNAPVKGLKNKISALLAGMLSSCDNPELYSTMSAGFIGGYIGVSTMMSPTSWSLAAYEKGSPKNTRAAELDGVEKSILIGMADDVVVSVKSHWVEMVVTKRFDTPIRADLPRFTGLSHICVMVDSLEEGCAYYKRLLGAVVDHYLPHWKNEGFFKAAGFIEEAVQGEISIAFLNLPGTRLTLELMEYHSPVGRREPVVFAANDISGARHVALKVTNIEEAFLHVKAQPDATLINQTENYRVFRISETRPEDVRFFDQDRRGTDGRNVETARILSGVSYFYFIDKYGLQWEFEQGHTDIGD